MRPPSRPKPIASPPCKPGYFSIKHSGKSRFTPRNCAHPECGPDSWPTRRFPTHPQRGTQTGRLACAIRSGLWRINARGGPDSSPPRRGRAPSSGNLHAGGALGHVSGRNRVGISESLPRRAFGFGNALEGLEDVQSGSVASTRASAVVHFGRSRGIRAPRLLTHPADRLPRLFVSGCRVRAPWPP
jgi:hypothetical protein